MAVPKLEPSVTLLMRWLGIMDSLPRLTDAAVKIVEMRRKDDSHVSVCTRLDLIWAVKNANLLG